MSKWKIFFFWLYPVLLYPSRLLCAFPSNAAIRQHVQTSKGLFPHKRVTRKSEMTNRGLVVTEVVEDIAGPSGAIAGATTPGGDNNSGDASPVKRSPIAELLYMRWLEGLKIKWPNILS